MRKYSWGAKTRRFLCLIIYPQGVPRRNRCIKSNTTSLYPQGAPRIPITDENISIENSKKSLISLYSKLKKYYKKDIANLVIIFEPTGSYSVLLKRFCADKSIYTFIINPRQSANFAKALDNRSKSDIIDAKMLYKFNVMLKNSDIAVPLINKAQEELSEMLSYYKFLQKQRVGFSNHLEALSAKDGSLYIRKNLNKEIKQLKEQEEEMILKMKSLIVSDEIMAQKFAPQLPG